ncbi:GroES-like protein [Lophiostoma macrostomum CBS 122681]|uniref:GroES-like protein n=1 Tax=Lophiostoma macrostomum CBS 122681 TaxID=1314788 RepID=A0A6A6TIS8_9PLEO|nr:GroES-like protein [Lophiostoma macrostomum CBS 122681]
MSTETHSAIATIAVKTLGIIQVPTIAPTGDEVRVRVEWTASTPLDLHQNDGALLVKHPQVLGDGTAGTVVEVGPDAKRLKVGDKVFGFTWREAKEKAHQEFCTSNEWLFAKLPEGFTLQQAVTLPNNFVTVFHSVTADLGLELPEYPKPENSVPEESEAVILIWGGSSSVGQYATQILNYFGYKNIATTASKRHHEKLRSFGARWAFDYNDTDVVEQLLNFAKKQERGIPYILDCIGSQNGSVRPISKIASRGAKVAILLPVIVKDSSETEDPEYAMDVQTAANWEAEVDVKGVRTHFYTENEFFKFNLQSRIMPSMLKDGIVKPNEQRIVGGNTMLERAQNAMTALRRKEVSGERLVWRVSDE